MAVRRTIVRLLGRGSQQRPRPGVEKPDGNDLMAAFRWCLERRMTARPHYLWGVMLGAHTARVLGVERIAAIEFGVAGGNGLLELERAATTAAEVIGVEVVPVGFDTGTGMPPPADHRDVPFVIREGYFPMDERALRERLRSAELVLGPVAETLPAWDRGEHPPVGFVAFDLDYYSSTMEAFVLLEGPAERLLPRIACYFDDVLGYGWSDFNGERAAIADFNDAHAQRKIAKVHGLRYELPPSEFMLPWHEKLYVAHLFDHPLYDAAEPLPQGPLAEAFFAAHRLQPE